MSRKAIKTGSRAETPGLLAFEANKTHGDPKMKPVPRNRIGRKPADLPTCDYPKRGDEIGRLTVDSDPFRKSTGKQLRWHVRCVCCCGNVKDIDIYSLKRHTRSCGCWHRDRTSEVRHKHGEGKTRLYVIWSHMKSRCSNPDGSAAKDYHDKGIRVDPRWLAYEPFRDWSLANGYSDDLSIDRIDNDGSYSPENCRWADRITQGRNRSNNVVMSAFGDEKTLAEWAEDPRCVVAYGTLKSRIRHGWRATEAITRPSRKSK